MKEWLKDHFDLGAFTPKPVGYCKREAPYECDGCMILNLVAWFIQATIVAVLGVGALIFVILTMFGVIKF